MRERRSDPHAARRRRTHRGGVDAVVLVVRRAWRVSVWCRGRSGSGGSPAARACAHRSRRLKHSSECRLLTRAGTLFAVFALFAAESAPPTCGRSAPTLLRSVEAENQLEGL